ncbi:MAG: F0F1 ATP synthase subunit delta [Acidiphilium sp.]|nr:F0F1 ATP synthase subunit delta [Acidiphilium sp.]MDD4934478.1 F0F1 ATP synthase subunit delta [Acidiphilium sp.]
MTLDWRTLLLQTANVLILIWLLGRYFWRPVAAMIEQRRLTAQRSLDEAASSRHQASTALAEIEATRAGFAQERAAILAAAHEDAERSRIALLAKATENAAALQASAATAIETARENARQDWADRASDLALAIAGRLAARLDGAAVRAAFLDGLLREIATLPEPVRRAAAASGTLEAISATTLDPSEQDRCRERIASAFGDAPKIVFRTDPALIAGLEMRGDHFVLRNSWRADLDQIRAEINHDSATR